MRTESAVFLVIKIQIIMNKYDTSIDPSTVRGDKEEGNCNFFLCFVRHKLLLKNSQAIKNPSLNNHIIFTLLQLSNQ